MKPLVKWAGGKTWLAQITHDVFVTQKPKKVIELFAGSAAFSLRNEFRNVTLNDTNRALINLYQQLARGYQIDLDDFKLDETLFYALREELNQALIQNTPLTEREAAIFWYLCKHSFNGLVRQSKKKGTFNMPFGRYKKLATPPDTKQFMSIAKEWQFHCGCFSDIDISDADFLLVDPPYEKTFRGYTNDPNIDLPNKIIKKLSHYDGAVIITNTLLPNLTTLHREAGFKVYKAAVRRSISQKAQSRGQVFELVALRGFSSSQFRRLNQTLLPIE